MAPRARLVYGAAVRSLAAACLALAACAGARPAAGGGGGPGAASDDPAQVLRRFAAAVRQGRLDEAWPLLAARWRDRSTPASLAADLAASGRVGRDAAARAEAMLGAGGRPAVEGDRAVLAVGEGKAALLVREDGSWRVDALE